MLGMDEKELAQLLEQELFMILPGGEVILQTEEVLRKANALIVKAIVANNAEIEKSLKGKR
jgi:hypothetical protein